MALGGTFRNPKKDSSDLRGRQDIERREQQRIDQQRQLQTYQSLTLRGGLPAGKAKKSAPLWRKPR